MSTENKKHKIAILISHPIQYHVPIFKELNARQEIDLKVYFSWDFGVEKTYDDEFQQEVKWDIPLLKGYDYKFLKNISWSPGANFFGKINPGIISELFKNDYDSILIHGYTSLTNVIAVFAARLSGTKVMMRGVTHLLNKKPWYIEFLKKIILTPLFKLCNLCLYIGSHNYDFYKKYGVKDDKLFFTPHVVNNDFFQKSYEELSNQKGKIKKDFGLDPNKKTMLFAGKFIPKKRPLWVLEAFKEMQNKDDVQLLFVGDGELRKDIKEKIDKSNISDVIIAGFLNQTEMPKAYIASDILVLPSGWGETWGLVVNEAMNFGLPIIVSDKVGSSRDLVQDNQNGYIIKSIEDLTSALDSLVKNEDIMRKYGEKSKEIIKSYNVKSCVDGIIKALNSINYEKN